ncbi:MAG: acetyl-CoA carboxylase biotin carboxyl carrier protein [Bacteroidia bacterium]|nr:acetyl-CoA carboxylase biotin carboxyl carrier protein [Bacteroidia bacterium]
MQLKEIQELIKFVSRSGVSEVEIENNGFKIVIKTPTVASVAVPQVVTVAPAPVIAAPIAAPVSAPAVVEPTPAAASPAKAEDTSKYIAVKSPMIGTFYRSSSPEKPPLVSVGDEIKKGDVLCIIEAMKLFNEIESEFSGKIVKVLVDDASPVEYDQALYLIDPA